jgi:serine/threonine-protein kinase
MNPLSLAQQIDEVCNRFEAAWKAMAASVQPPLMEDYLPAGPEAEQAELLGELIALDIHYQRRLGKSPRLEDYAARFPALNLGAVSAFSRAGVAPTTGVVLRDLPGEATPVLPRPSAETDLLPADSSRYQFQGEIARGGVGAILKGRDLTLGRDLAIKVLLAAHETRPAMVQRFIEEAQVGGQLQHPGIVPVYEFGHFANQRPYFTMKLVHGQTLSVLLKERTEPQQDRPRLLKIFEQVCQTLAYAHARGVVHRDLKPLNVMVGAFGEVQVMDWGLAKVLGAAQSTSATNAGDRTGADTRASACDDLGFTRIGLTEAGEVMGTPAYMAPEQARGEVNRLDERCDVFGLGAILCEILTGRPPYTGRTCEAIREQATRADLAEAMGRLRTCGAEDELLQLTRACLAVEPKDRPRHGGVVAGQITAYLASVQERLRVSELAQAAALAKAVEERKRRRLTAALAVSVLVTAFLGMGGWTYLARAKAGRIVQTVREVNEVVGKAALLHEQARAAGVGGLAKWNEALATLEQAERILAAGEADAETHHRVQRLLTEMTAEAAAMRQDQRMAARVEEIRLQQTLITGDRIDRSSADPVYAEAFRDYGIDVETLAIDEAATLVRQRPIADKLAAALDDWASVKSDDPGRQRLIAIARAADSDEWRNQCRDAFVRHDLPTMRILALSGKATTQPPTTLYLLGRALYTLGDNKAALALLRRAQRRYPDDFWINEQLAGSLWAQEPPQLDDACRYFTAALSVRPQSQLTRVNLGGVLNEKGAHDEAIALLQDTIALNPNISGAHINLGNALRDKGALDQALSAFRQAVRCKPDFALAHYNLGGALNMKGSTDEALTEFKEAIRLQPAYAKAHFQVGMALAKKGAMDEAIAAYREALRVQPTFFEAFNNLGALLCDRKKDYDGAIAAFREAIRLRPGHFASHANLGNALWHKGLLDQARGAFEEAVRLKPDDVQAQHFLAGALLQLGRTDEAIAAYKETLRLDPGNVDDQTNLGILLDRKGDLDGAADAFRQALRLKPDYAHGYINLAVVLYRKEGGLKESIACLREAIRLRPGEADFHFRLGLALEQNQSWDEAIAAYQKCVHEKPDHAQAYGNLANVFMKSGRRDEALRAYREAARLAPENVQALTTVAFALKEKGLLEESLDAYRQALRLKPDYAEAHVGFGMALELKGDFDGALVAYREAIRLKPDYVLACCQAAAVLCDRKRQYGEALATIEHALRLQPDSAVAHNYRGAALFGTGAIDEAIGAFREAIRCDRTYADAYCHLGQMLRAKGQFTEALTCLRQAHDLGAKKPSWPYSSARMIQECERLIVLDNRLPAVLLGSAGPLIRAERIEYARFFLQYKQLYGTAAGFFEQAFTENPGPAQDLGNHDRYDAARAAAQVARGQGEDAALADATQRTRRRQQALDWLRAELAIWAKLLDEKKSHGRAQVANALRDWQREPALAGIRDAAALAQLPQSERDACRELWAEVGKLLARSAEGT